MAAGGLIESIKSGDGWPTTAEFLHFVEVGSFGDKGNNNAHVATGHGHTRAFYNVNNPECLAVSKIARRMAWTLRTQVWLAIDRCLPPQLRRERRAKTRVATRQKLTRDGQTHLRMSQYSKHLATVRTLHVRDTIVTAVYRYFDSTCTRPPAHPQNESHTPHTLARSHYRTPCEHTTPTPNQHFTPHGNTGVAAALKPGL